MLNNAITLSPWRAPLIATLQWVAYQIISSSLKQTNKQTNHETKTKFSILISYYFLMHKLYPQWGNQILYLPWVFCLCYRLLIRLFCYVEFPFQFQLLIIIFVCYIEFPCQAQRLIIRFVCYVEFLFQVQLVFNIFLTRYFWIARVLTLNITFRQNFLT